MPYSVLVEIITKETLSRLVIKSATRSQSAPCTTRRPIYTSYQCSLPSEFQDNFKGKALTVESKERQKMVQYRYTMVYMCTIVHVR